MDRWRSPLPCIDLSCLLTNRYRTWELLHLVSPECKKTFGARFFLASDFFSPTQTGSWGLDIWIISNNQLTFFILGTDVGLSPQRSLEHHHGTSVVNFFFLVFVLLSSNPTWLENPSHDICWCLKARGFRALNEELGPEMSQEGKRWGLFLGSYEGYIVLDVSWCTLELNKPFGFQVSFEDINVFDYWSWGNFFLLWFNFSLGASRHQRRCWNNAIKT